MLQNNSKLKTIFLLGFLFSLSAAFTSYINSSFLSIFLKEKNVGLIYVAGSIFAIFLLSFIPFILRKIGEYKFILLISSFIIAVLFILSTTKSPTIIIPIFILYFALNYLIIFSLDEFIQIFTQNSSKGYIHGLYLTLVNLAWVLSQIISSKTSSNFSLSSHYFVAFLTMIVFFAIALLTLRKTNDPKYDKTFAWDSVRKFLKEKNLTRAYKINFVLQFFYVWMVIYIPIYLSSHLNFSWQEIGIIFTIMLLPFVLFQFPLGKYSDKIGERKILIFGFCITALSVFSLFFIQEHILWIWALLLFFSRVGAATIEVMSDVYFFKHIKQENDEFISIYRNAGPMAYIIAPIVALFVFSFTPSFNFIFPILGIIVLSGAYISSKIPREDI